MKNKRLEHYLEENDQFKYLVDKVGEEHGNPELVLHIMKIAFECGVNSAHEANVRSLNKRVKKLEEQLQMELQR